MKEMEVLKITGKVLESSTVVTLEMNPTDMDRWNRMEPGQFIMVWIPGLDEIPMSVSFIGGEPRRLAITVQGIGNATKALCGMEEGDLIGIRGPYGKGFNIPDPEDIDQVIGVSGGVGAASTIMALEKARENGIEVVNLVGARSADILIYRNRWNSFSDRLEIATDDGSTGYHGFVTDLLEKELSKMEPGERKRVEVFTCGPELMMKKVHGILDEYDVRGQFSLERLMKCGVGLCDSCAVSGIRVCQDGPVLDFDQLGGLEDFGISQRDRSGRVVSIRECV
jgi:dihydroorotate dehydrogenase electron transfer subunit